MSSGFAILMDIFNNKIDFSYMPKGYKTPKLSNLERISARRSCLCMETDKDHIHLLIDYAPKVSVLQIVRRLKQETTFELWKVHESYLKKHFWKERTFWSDGYFACSIGEGTSYDTIQEYIKNQG